MKVEVPYSTYQNNYVNRDERYSNGQALQYYSKRISEDNILIFQIIGIIITNIKMKIQAKTRIQPQTVPFNGREMKIDNTKHSTIMTDKHNVLGSHRSFYKSKRKYIKILTNDTEPRNPIVRNKYVTSRKHKI